MKYWGQLIQYLSSFEARAGLQVLNSFVLRPFVAPPNARGFFLCIGGHLKANIRVFN